MSAVLNGQILVIVPMTFGAATFFPTVTTTSFDLSLSHLPPNDLQTAEYKVCSLAGETLITPPVCPSDHTIVPKQPDAVSVVSPPLHIKLLLQEM
jgi:hypothetical protein